MSKVYDEAHRLVASIKDSKEYTDFVRLEMLLSSDEKLMDEIKNFQSLQVELQTSQLMGKPLDEKLMTIAQEKLDKLNETPEALEYFQAEMDLNKIFKEISQIIGDAMTLLG